MYCTKCGAFNEDHAVNCAKCGSQLQQFSQQAAVKIPNYLVPAILVTLLCCVPFGIPAIVFAAQVNGRISAGDIEGAKDKSRKALTWCWVSFGSGLAVIVLYMILMMMGVIAEGF